jgi:hypothetical protein
VPLLVIGARGRRGMPRVFGSVAERLVRTATRPVLVGPERGLTPVPREKDINNTEGGPMLLIRPILRADSDEALVDRRTSTDRIAPPKPSFDECLHASMAFTLRGRLQSPGEPAATRCNAGILERG